MTTKKSGGPFGPLHSDSIRRANDMPKPAKGFSNTTPGYSGPPVLHTPKDAPGTERKKK